MERVTLSQAVNSICGPESSSSHNYMNIDNDLMYMDQTVSSNVLDPNCSYSKEHSMTNETITSSYSTTTTSSTNETATSGGISTAMSQYVNALKNAGLPTDLPILFESGDGSYINVNEQVLLDMVQSSEIQYEVIEQPNIIEKVADPSEIKSIDDLSKSIERGEMLMGGKNYPSTSDYDKDNQYNRHEDTINSLNSILPDNLESFGEQQNYVVMDPRLQENNNMDPVNPNDFSCIDGDMQFFTKSMSDDVKKYYEDQQLHDPRVMEQLCPTSTTLDTNFNIPLLDSKSSHLSGSMSQPYNPLNPEDLRRNEDCYDFGLQLPQSTAFKDDALDCLMATPKRTDEDNHQLDKRTQERDEIIQDLMNIEKNINNSSTSGEKSNFDSNVPDYNDSLNVDSVFNEPNSVQNEHLDTNKDSDDLTSAITSSGIQWDDSIVSNQENDNDKTESPDTENRDENAIKDTHFDDSVIDLTEPKSMELDERPDLDDEIDADKENYPSGSDVDNNSCLDNDIPYSVELLPLKQVQPTEDVTLLKRKNSIDDLLENVDAACLKRKVKYKKLCDYQ